MIFYVLIIALAIINLVTIIKNLDGYNKLCDKNLELLKENIMLRYENSSYEETLDTLLKSNFNLTQEEPAEPKKRGRKKKNNDL